MAPRPCGVVWNGMPAASTNACISASASDQSTPVPVISAGCSALTMRSTSAGAVRARPLRVVIRRRVLDLRLVDLLVEDVPRHIEVDRARLAGHRLRNGKVDELGDAPHVVHAVRPLGARLEDCELVDVLECAAMPGSDRRRAAECNDWRAIGPRVRDAGEEVGYARSGGRHAK